MNPPQPPSHRLRRPERLLPSNRPALHSPTKSSFPSPRAPNRQNPTQPPKHNPKRPHSPPRQKRSCSCPSPRPSASSADKKVFLVAHLRAPPRPPRKKELQLPFSAPLRVLRGKKGVLSCPSPPRGGKGQTDRLHQRFAEIAKQAMEPAFGSLRAPPRPPRIKKGVLRSPLWPFADFFRELRQSRHTSSYAIAPWPPKIALDILLNIPYT